MKILYCIESETELPELKRFADENRILIKEYIEYIEKEIQAVELPKALVLTGKEIATSSLTDIPIPAYTNEHRIVFAPCIVTWREIYLSQLEGLIIEKDHQKTVSEIEHYYNHVFSKNHVLQILGHELAHHSDLFFDDFSETLHEGIWFEEGMVEYISRKYFLTQEEFQREKEVNQKIVDLLSKTYGKNSLEDFGESTYQRHVGGIFYEYWRSFLAVDRIVENHQGDIHKVFASYHRHKKENPSAALTKWFSIE